MINLRGIVVPFEWDKYGNITEYCLEAFDETSYLIESMNKIEQKLLLELAGKEVELTGHVVPFPDGGTFRVQHGRLVQDRS